MHFITTKRLINPQAFYWVGIYGCSIDIISNSKEGFNLSSLNYSTGIHAMYSGIDWLYTHVETMYIYDYKIVYFWLLNSIYDESIDFFFSSLWFLSLQTSAFQLFWSILLDSYISNVILQFNLTDEWVRSFISSKDTALFVLNHPEILFFKGCIINNFFFDFLTDINISAVQYLEAQSLLTPIMLFPQLLFLHFFS